MKRHGVKTAATALGHASAFTDPADSNAAQACRSFGVWPGGAYRVKKNGSAGRSNGPERCKQLR